jgi:hypothetical protein
MGNKTSHTHPITINLLRGKKLIVEHSINVRGDADTTLGGFDLGKS